MGLSGNRDDYRWRLCDRQGISGAETGRLGLLGCGGALKECPHERCCQAIVRPIAEGLAHWVRP